MSDKTVLTNTTKSSTLSREAETKQVTNYPENITINTQCELKNSIDQDSNKSNPSNKSNKTECTPSIKTKYGIKNNQL